LTATALPDTAAKPAPRPRFWEIDAWRGVAIITMIVYHLMWDLWYWRVLPDVVLWKVFGDTGSASPPARFCCWSACR
jgi:uncharacterized membrane protein